MVKRKKKSSIRLCNNNTRMSKVSSLFCFQGPFLCQVYWESHCLFSLQARISCNPTKMDLLLSSLFLDLITLCENIAPLLVHEIIIYIICFSPEAVT